MTTRPSREQIIAVLDREGACCGSCGREPGSPLSECQGCEHCLGDYADAVLRLLDTLPDAFDCWEAGHHAGEHDAATSVARGGMYRTPKPERSAMDYAEIIAFEAARATRAERERDAAVARAEVAERERDHGLMEIAEFREELVGAHARAEQAEAAYARCSHKNERLADENDYLTESATSAVSRADVSEVVHGVFSTWYDNEDMVDAVCDLFGIEAEQATDPVEELAGQIETATRDAIRTVVDSLTAVAPGLTPPDVEGLLDQTIRDQSHTIAAHVLGQKEDQ